MMYAFGLVQKFRPKNNRHVFQTEYKMFLFLIYSSEDIFAVSFVFDGYFFPRLVVKHYKLTSY